MKLNFKLKSKKMKLKIPDHLIKNLWENSSDYQTDWFFYNKIFDERDFWLEKWELNIEKLQAYKEILKREYFDYLGELKYYDRYFKTKKFQNFLKIKNELKYILDVLFNLWEVEAFYFWYDFKTDDWDENEKFWKDTTSEEKKLVFGEKKVEDTKKVKKLKKEIEKLEKNIEKFKTEKNLNEDIENKIERINERIENLEILKKHKESELNGLKNKAILEIIVDKKGIDKKEFGEIVYEKLINLFVIKWENIKSLSSFLIRFSNSIWLEYEKVTNQIWEIIQNNVLDWLKNEDWIVRDSWVRLLWELSKEENLRKKILKIIQNNVLDWLKDKNRWIRDSWVRLLWELAKYDDLKGKIWKIIQNNVLDWLKNEDRRVRYSWVRLLWELAKYEDLRQKFLKIFNPQSIHHQIENFLSFESGSFLLTGYRWVGKTTLLKQLFEKYNKKTKKENKEQLIPVFVNIPEPTNKKWWKKEFDKKQLMDFIIRNLYFKIQNYKKDLPKDFVEKIEDQYIRTYSNVKNFNIDLIIKRNFAFRFILAILKYSIPFLFTLWLYIFQDNIIKYIKEHYSFWENIVNFIQDYIWTGIFQVVVALFIFIISSKLWFSIFNGKFKAKFIETLYDENIAEQKLVDNILAYTKKRKKFIIKALEYLKNLNPKKFIRDIWNLIKALSSYIWFKITYKASYLWYFALFLTLIFGTIKYWFNIWIIWIWSIIIWFIIIILFQPKPKYKFVIVIDELDKLLDFEKVIDKQDGKLDMEQIFDVLWKLKILFFDTKWVLFFAVANKNAYDYYLKHRNKEDDLISNIFNQIAYLPMNTKEKFNLHYSFVKDISQEKLFDLNTWIYFKSHWNWRKSRFILNNLLKNKELQIRINEEDEFVYKFFSDLYEILKKWSLDNFETETALYKYFVDKQIISEMYDKLKSWDYKNFVEKLWLEKFLNETDKLNYIKWFVASIDKISYELAYRDYILNSLLNLYETFKEWKINDLKESFKKIGIKEEDLVYDDLIKYYLPLMFYVLNKENENSWNEKW